jgi:hypothetical protein
VPLGLSVEETLRGQFWPLDAAIDERGMTLRLEVRARDLRTLARERSLVLHGTLDAEGLATRAEIEGSISLHRLDRRRLPYRVRFRGDDGRRYELSGEKEWMPVSPVESVTTLSATLYDERGEEWARALLRFDVRHEWSAWVKSLRLHLFG